MWLMVWNHFFQSCTVCIITYTLPLRSLVLLRLCLGLGFAEEKENGRQGYMNTSKVTYISFLFISFPLARTTFKHSLMNFNCNIYAPDLFYEWDCFYHLQQVFKKKVLNNKLKVVVEQFFSLSQVKHFHIGIKESHFLKLYHLSS